MGDIGDRVFNLNPKGAGTLKLQDVVQERLLGFMEADYTDKVLAEYIVVLVAHGKTQRQAAGELEAFLGAEISQSFTKWLWDHVSENLAAYADAGDTHGGSGRDADPRQSDTSSESEPSEGPETGEEEPVRKSPTGADSRQGEEHSSLEKLSARDAHTDKRRSDGRLRGDEQDWRSTSDQRRRDGSDRGFREAEGRHYSENRRHSRSPTRKEGGRHRRDEHRDRKDRRFEERRDQRERGWGYQVAPPPPPRGEPFLEERRGDREQSRRDEQRARFGESARLSSRREEEVVGEKRSRPVARADLDTPDMPDEPPPPPRSRPRLAGIPNFARMMGVALKAVAEAADEAAQAAKGVLAPPPPKAGSAIRARGGADVWNRLGQEPPPREEPQEEKAPTQRSQQVWESQEMEQPGLESERRRMNAKLWERLRSADDVPRKVVRTGPSGPSVTVTFGGAEQAVRRAAEETGEQVGREGRRNRHGTGGRKGREHNVEEMDEVVETPVEKEIELEPIETQPEEEEWHEEEEPEGAAMDEFVEGGAEELEAEVSVDADVAEMRQRMRAVQLEMIKLRAKQRETEQSKGKAPLGIKPLVKAPTPRQLDARTVFVSNVHFAATKEALAVHFGEAGTVTDVRILLDPATGRSRGCAFITFDSEEAREAALALDNTSILTRQIKVAPKSSAAAILATQPTFVPKPIPTFVPKPLPTPPLVRGPRPPLRRGSTKWVRPGATIPPPAKSPRAPSIPQNLTWRRSASEEAQPAGQAVGSSATDLVVPIKNAGSAVVNGAGPVISSVDEQSPLKSGGAVRRRSVKLQRPSPYSAP